MDKNRINRRTSNNDTKVIKWVLLGMIGLLIVNWAFFFRLLYPFHYRDKIERHAQTYQLDSRLVVSIVRTESKFRATALSSKGAVGLMQIMPETGLWIAQQIGRSDFTVDMLKEPDENIQFGCWYLQSLNLEFQGEIIIVLAAYNAGRGNVKQWLNNGVWDGSLESLDQIPYPETRNYIRRVIGAYAFYARLYPQI